MAPGYVDGWARLGYDGFCFEGEGGDTFVSATQRFAAGEAFEGFDAQGEFACDQGTLCDQVRASAEGFVGVALFGGM